MNNAATTEVPEQKQAPWSTAFSVAWAGIRRRPLRALITTSGVVLATGFLAYMLVTGSITRALVSADINEVNIQLQRAGTDIIGGGRLDSRSVLLLVLALITCMTGIANSMLMSVTERVGEIGTMKCLGALDSFIMRIYFLEAAIMGVLGTTAGLVAGFTVAVLSSAATCGGYTFRLMPWSAVAVSMSVAFATGAVLSVLAAVYPAAWAAKKAPVEAMRVEE